jgi:anti-anti-sigma factor
MDVEPARSKVHRPGQPLFPPTCTVCVYRHPGWTAVLLRGELDLSTVDRLRESIEAELRADTPVLIELTGLDFCDARGAALLVRLVEAAAENRTAEVELHGARGQIRDVLLRAGWKYV